MVVFIVNKGEDMTKKEKKEEADDGTPRFRQIQIAGLNESINLISNYESEDMNFLSRKAMKMYRELKNLKE